MNGGDPAFPATKIETDLVGDGSGQKFPHVYTHSEGGGLTKRELFAALIAQGIVQSAAELGEADDSADEHERAIAENSVSIADALIAALNK
jgi:hypothetical protein